MLSGPHAVNSRAMALRAQGALHDAIAVLRDGTTSFPSEVTLHLNLAHALYESGKTNEAIDACTSALRADADSVAAHLLLFELLLIGERRDEALAHQRLALARQHLFSSPAPAQRRSVLALCAPGDWQSNIPIDFLFDRTTTSVHKLFLVDGFDARNLPHHDIVWNTIAESDENVVYLERAQEFITGQ